MTHSQSNSLVMLDEVDTATSKFDHVQQPQQDYPDHVISFHQSQSDPVNRGLLIKTWCMLLTYSLTCTQTRSEQLCEF